MNVKDRTELKDLKDLIIDIRAETSLSLDSIKEHNIKHYYSIKNIESILQDDPNSNTAGIVTKVNKLDEEVRKIIAMNRIVKRASVFMLTLAGGVAAFLIKRLF